MPKGGAVFGWRLFALVSAFTALMTFQPGEPFLLHYLSCFKNIPRVTVIHDIFPIWSYSYLMLLPVLCGIAEVMGHRWAVLIGAIGKWLTALVVVLPVSTGSVPLMQLSQITLAVGFASHPALSAIMYRGMPRESYVSAAGCMSTVGVFSSVSASLVGQQLLSKGMASLSALFVLSFAFTSMGLLVTFALPGRQPRPAFAAPPPQDPGDSGDLDKAMPLFWDSGSRQVSRQYTNEEASTSAPAGQTNDQHLTAVEKHACWLRLCSHRAQKFQRKAHLVVSDTLHILSHSGAMYYYGWMSVATAVHHLVVIYWQAAMPGKQLESSRDTCEHHQSTSCNGYVQAGASIFGGLAALMPMVWERCLSEHAIKLARGLSMVVAPVLLAALLCAMSSTHGRDWYAAYYVSFHMFFEYMRVVCDAEGARCIASARVRGAPRFAAVSGLNMVLCLSLQSVLQMLVYRLNLAVQFRVLAALLAMVSFVYAGLVVSGRSLDVRY